MEQTKRLEMLRELCELDSVSSCEDKAAQWIQSHLPQDCRAYRDARGNLICEKKGRKTPKNKLMLTAHMDEVGFIITYIEESGLLRFEVMGDIDTRVVVAKPVRLESGKEGVIGAKPIHLQTAEERSVVLKFSELYIDIGAKSRQEAEQFVSLGDVASFCTAFTPIGTKVAAKALDNRTGCLALLELLHEDLAYDLTAVFTAQEEIGGGAGNAAFALKPDIAIVVGASDAQDVPGVSASKRRCALGKGVVLTMKHRGGNSDRELFDGTKKLCEENKIPYQINNQMTDRTDAAAISKAGSGCRTMNITIPVRYTHSPSSVCDPKDMESAAQLLKIMVEQFGDR